MSKQNLAYAGLILLALALVGAGIWRQVKQPAQNQAVSQNQDQPLTASLLENASIRPTIESGLGAVNLTGGTYDWPSGKVGLFGDYMAFGDLGGGASAAAVTYETNGTHGTYYSVVALRDENGKAVSAGAAYLGDQVQVKSLEIKDGEIIVDYLTQRQDDFIVNPTLEVTERYKLTPYGKELQ